MVLFCRVLFTVLAFDLGKKNGRGKSHHVDRLRVVESSYSFIGAVFSYAVD